MHKIVKEVVPGTFEPTSHFYPATLDTQLHSTVADFLRLDNHAVAARYTALNPGVDQAKLEDVLSYAPKHFLWAGSDILKVTDRNGRKQMVVVETNSCPSGQKSMPRAETRGIHNGFRIVMDTFKDLVSQLDRATGSLAVVFDKNLLEASGYAATMADVLEEPVYLVEFSNGDRDPSVRWVDGFMQVRNEVGDWRPIRACFRYVTQTPWDRIPIHSKTVVLNPTIACVAGGRNKAVAALAYEQYNTELSTSAPGLQLRVPLTRRDVRKAEVPALVRAMGGHAVVKVPYSNAGQGVYTITNATELDAFMALPEAYEKLIVQALVGRREWLPSTPPQSALFHVGTRPDKNGSSHVFDLRFMVAGSPSGEGFRPVAIYARRARAPLKATLDGGEDSWAMLGTNLSVQKIPGHQDHTAWATETDRLVLMSQEGFDALGLDADDLINAYVQTVLSSIAVDKMCERLLSKRLIKVTEQPPQQETPVVPRRLRESVLKPFTRRLQIVFNSELFKAWTRDNVLYNQIMNGSWWR